jgi:tRNA pseudouridine38-40 synthase
MYLSHMKIRMEVSYLGTEYCGWQIQKHGNQKSVCETVVEALERVLQHKVELYASGRTDAGVHALSQQCHFVTTKDENFFKNCDLAWALKALLPDSISVRRVWEAPSDFHSTLSAVGKTYKYFVYSHPRSNPFLRPHSYWVRFPLDLELLNAYSKEILGENDYKSFQSVGTPVAHTVRQIMKAEWRLKSPRVYEFSVTGSGFLKQMVRNLVGTMLMLEKRRAPPSEMKSILLAMDRKKAGPPAPPEGLFLWKVYYPRKLDNRCREL